MMGMSPPGEGLPGPTRRFTRRHVRAGVPLLLLPALVLVTTTVARAANDAAAPTTTAKPAAKKIDNDDLIRQASSLLDPLDDHPKARRHAGTRSARPGAATAKGAPDAAVEAGAAQAPFAADAAPTEASTDGRTADASPAVAPDASAPPVASAAPVIPPPQEPPPSIEPPSNPPAPSGVGRAARAARVASGRNLEPQGPLDSPLAKFMPLKAVPVVATAVAAGGMAVWPFLAKVVTGLFKKLAAGFLKKRGKKDHKVDETLFTLNLLGFKLRPSELASLVVAALTYGLAVCYTLQGWKMRLPFVTSQEFLIVAIYFSRSIVRFVYERAYKLTTQYRFWPAGGLLCLGSAYLGNTLGTVGFEVESTTKPGDAERIVKMKAGLIVLALAAALVFFGANVLHPAKILQSGRTMLSGMALGEILPVQPMPGHKIYRWRSDVWVVLFVTVVLAFFLINFVL
jgi:hypothetical protein